MKNFRLVHVLLLLPALLLGACGDGGSLVDPQGLMSGNYQIHQVGDASLGGAVETARVDITADGSGAGAGNIAAGNHSAGYTGGGTFTYAVAADRTVSIDNTTGTVSGMVAADGSLMVLSDTDRAVSAVPPLSDAGIVLAAGMKKTSGMTVANMNGDYQIHQFGSGGTGGYFAKVARVNVTADGLGAGTWNIAAHSVGGGGNGIFDYTVNGVDGTFTVTSKDATGITTLGTDYGIISADGSMFLLSDTNLTATAVPPVEDAEIILAVGVKKSTGMTNFALNGNYLINQIGDAGLGMMSTAQVNISADGSGNGTYSVIASSAGGAGSSGIFSYVVAADGTFTVTTPAGTDYGIISADGSVFVISDANPLGGIGPPVEDSEIVLAVGIRK